jgi:serine/threonine-protein kinase
MLSGQQLGPFTVEKEIGSGAMGSVYRAHYTKTGQRVAIKIVAPGLAGSDRAVERFEREASILKQLRHPNIVRIYATGKYHGTPFYAMEYIKGESLDHAMARRGRMTWEEVVTLGRQLCAALQHAHQQGIIHRDLKPSNLMVLPDGTVKLTDFGIAKDLDVTQLTSANCTVGTAAYMSPEQCKGERDLTHKSDLYSLGVLFYELITGRKPFIAETPMDMFLMHVQGTFERPSRIVLDIPVWLDTLICQLLEKKPAQRPLDAATVAQTLERIEEKVQAQQSAGVDLVKSRMADRPRDLAEMDEEDKAAARTLLGRKKKKKRKSGGVPFYYQIWFKAVVYSALLVGVGVVLFLAFKPASPEALYEKAAKLMEDPDNWDDAREVVDEYLKRNKDRNDKQAKQMRDWADQIDRETQERRMLNWIAWDRPMTTDPERLAKSAVMAERDGRLADAEKNWNELAQFKERSDRELHAWGLVGHKRVQDINQVKSYLKGLEQRVLHLERGEDDPDEMTYQHPQVYKNAARAYRYVKFGDVWTALDHWQKLHQEIRPSNDQPDFHLWFVLGTAQVKLLNTQVKEQEEQGKNRRSLVQNRFKEALKLVNNKPRQARAILQDIRDLYEKNPDERLARLAADARDLLEQLGPKLK